MNYRMITRSNYKIDFPDDIFVSLKVGSIGIWMFRPFPLDEFRRLTGGLKKLIVVDRSCSYGHSGIFAQEARSALYDLEKRPEIIGVIAGLGGREILVHA